MSTQRHVREDTYWWSPLSAKRLKYVHYKRIRLFFVKLIDVTICSNKFTKGKQRRIIHNVIVMKMAQKINRQQRSKEEHIDLHENP